MRGHADLDGARPLVHHLVDAHLEHLVGVQRAAAQDHAVIEVVRSTARGKIHTIKCIYNILYIINWVVQALNADWLKAVVYQTVCNGYDKTFIIAALITLVTNF